MLFVDNFINKNEIPGEMQKDDTLTRENNVISSGEKVIVAMVT